MSTSHCAESSSNKMMPAYTFGIYGIQADRVFDNSCPVPDTRSEDGGLSVPQDSTEISNSDLNPNTAWNNHPLTKKRSHDTNRALEDIFYMITTGRSPYVHENDPSTRRSTVFVSNPTHELLQRSTVSMIGPNPVTSTRVACIFNAVRVDLSGIDNLKQYLTDYRAVDDTVLKEDVDANIWIDLGIDGLLAMDKTKIDLTYVVSSVHEKLKKNSSVKREMTQVLEYGDGFEKYDRCIDILYNRTCQHKFNLSPINMSSDTCRKVESKDGCLDPSYPINKVRIIYIQHNNQTLRITIVPTPVNSSIRDQSNTIVSKIHHVGGSGPLGEPVCFRCIPKSQSSLMHMWYSASHGTKRQMNTDVLNIQKLHVEHAICADMQVYSIRMVINGRDVLTTWQVRNCGNPVSLYPLDPRSVATSFFSVKKPVPRLPTTVFPFSQTGNLGKTRNVALDQVKKALKDLETLTKQASIRVEKYIARGGIITPLALTSQDPWCKVSE